MIVPFNSVVGELNELQKCKGFVQQFSLDRDNDQASPKLSRYMSANLYDYLYYKNVKKTITNNFWYTSKSSPLILDNPDPDKK